MYFTYASAMRKRLSTVVLPEIQNKGIRKVKYDFPHRSRMLVQLIDAGSYYEQFCNWFKSNLIHATENNNYI